MNNSTEDLQEVLKRLIAVESKLKEVQEDNDRLNEIVKFLTFR